MAGRGELDGRGNAIARFAFAENPGPLEVAVAPAGFDDEEAHGLQTVTTRVDTRALSASKPLRVAPLVLSEVLRRLWKSWCRTLTIQGRVICADGRPVPQPTPDLAVFGRLLGVREAGLGKNIDPSKLETLRERRPSTRRLAHVPALERLRIWPWFPRRPWFDCNPDLIFRVTQACRGLDTVIVNEGLGSVRWNVPTELTVTLVANESACCLPVVVDPEGARGLLGAACGTGPWLDLSEEAIGTFSRSWWNTLTNKLPTVSFARVEIDGRQVYESRRRYETLHPGPWNVHVFWITGIETVASWLRQHGFDDGLYALRFKGSRLGSDGKLVDLSPDKGLPECGDPQQEAVMKPLVDNRHVEGISGHPTAPDHPCGDGTIHTCTVEPDTDILVVRLAEALLARQWAQILAADLELVGSRSRHLRPTEQAAVAGQGGALGQERPDLSGAVGAIAGRGLAEQRQPHRHRSPVGATSRRLPDRFGSRTGTRMGRPVLYALERLAQGLGVGSFRAHG